MSQPIAITGTFADLKSVKTRSVVQLIIECPIEKAADIVATFGFPQPGKEVPVAVARLVGSSPPTSQSSLRAAGMMPSGSGHIEEPAAHPSRAKENVERLLKEPEIAAIVHTPMAPAAKERRRWHELPPSQQAAIRCGEFRFQRFLSAKHGVHFNEESSAIHIRNFCKVSTRADIKPGTEAAQRWHELEKEYQAWLTVSA